MSIRVAAITWGMPLPAAPGKNRQVIQTTNIPIAGVSATLTHRCPALRALKACSARLDRPAKAVAASPAQAAAVQRTIRVRQRVKLKTRRGR